MSLERGTQLGPYEILDLLGEGGMGEVYRAVDPRLQRRVAIKVLAEQLSQDADLAARFHRENRAIAALNHPNIRVIFDVGTRGGRTFAVMELLEGETLGDRLKRSPLGWRDAVPIAYGVAEGLAAAHSAGIVHRDVKPRNIFLTTTGVVKLVDFGLAHWGARHEPREKADTIDEGLLSTQPGAVVGTPAYMSPEQIRGESTDGRSDIFSFGSVLYEMLIGSRLFARNTAAETMAAILRDEPPPLLPAQCDVPLELQQILRKCLEKDPDLRFQSAADLACELRMVGEAPVAAHSGELRVESLPNLGSSASRARSRTDPTIAVLPFVNISSEPDNELFSDGLAEELINALGKIGRLRVASRTSSFAFKGKSQDVREIGRRLRVATVLEGSVRKVGNRLRIAAELVSVSDGCHQWSEIYDREMEDVFAIQGEIAGAIVAALQVVLTTQERRALCPNPTSNIAAYECYLQGRQLFHQFRHLALERARTLYQQACALDLEYSAAYAGLAQCAAFLYAYWGRRPSSYADEALAASEKAIELAPQDPQAHVARGLAVSLHHNFEDAQAEFETALRLEPNSFDAHYIYARVCYEHGELARALQLFRLASRINPEDYEATCLATTVLAGLGCREECEAMGRQALERVTRHLELYPQDGRALYMGAIVCVHLQEKQRGLEWAERALAADPNEPLVRYNVACTYALLGKTEEAIDCLERAVCLGGSWLAWGENDPDLSSLREHPRFKGLMHRLRTTASA